MDQVETSQEPSQADSDAQSDTVFQPGPSLNTFRNGHRPDGKPRKHLDFDLNDAVAYTMHLVGRLAHPYQIYKLLVIRYKTSTHYAKKILVRAQERIKEHTGRSLEEHTCDAIAFWESVIRDPDATLGEKMHAQQQKERILKIGKDASQDDGRFVGEPGVTIRAMEIVVGDRIEARQILDLLPLIRDGGLPSIPPPAMTDPAILDENGSPN